MYRFLFRVEYLVLLEFDIANSKNLAILWNLYVIDIAATIADKVANVCLGPGFVGSSVLVCQNLISNGIGSATISIDVCGVWLVY